MQCGSNVLLHLSLHKGHRLLRGEHFLFKVKKEVIYNFLKYYLTAG